MRHLHTLCCAENTIGDSNAAASAVMSLVDAHVILTCWPCVVLVSNSVH